MAGVDVVFGEGINARESVISSDRFDGSGDTGVARKWGVIVTSEDFQT